MFRLGSAGRESWRLGEMSGDKAVVVERNGLIYIGETLGDGGHLYNGIMESHSGGRKRDRNTWPGGRRERIVHWTPGEIDEGFRVWGRRYNITRRKESKLLPSILEEQIHNRNTYIRLVP